MLLQQQKRQYRICIILSTSAAPMETPSVVCTCSARRSLRTCSGFVTTYTLTVALFAVRSYRRANHLQSQVSRRVATQHSWHLAKLVAHFGREREHNLHTEQSTCNDGKLLHVTAVVSVAR